MAIDELFEVQKKAFLGLRMLNKLYSALALDDISQIQLAILIPKIGKLILKMFANISIYYIFRHKIS